MKQVFTILLLAFSANAWAQGFEFRQKMDVKVVIGTDTLKNAWSGGLNSPVFSKIDLNKDNVEDLYVFDREHRKSFTFLAKQQSGVWQWVYAPEYEVLFPTDIESWVLLRDYDGDGDKDLISQSNFGMVVYRNETPLNGPLAFGAKAYIKFRLNTTAKPYNILYLGSYALPSLTDMDGDGDLDILTYDPNQSWTYISYYRNYRVERNYNADSLSMVWEDNNWGKFHSCGAPSCNSFIFDADANSCRVAGIKHGGGGSLLAMDLDGDQDKDLIAGADFCPDLVRLRNDAVGSTSIGKMRSAGLSTTYPTGTTAASIVNFPAAYSEDVTFDNKPDLLVAPFVLDAGDHPNFKQSAWLYTNASIANAPPVYTFQKKNFLQDQMIDMNMGALPVFVDIDGDGDQDMLVGNEIDFRNNAYSSGVVYLYTNVGNATKPIFKLTNTDYLQFSQAENGNGIRGIKLQFGDINNDGKKDLIVKYQTFALSGGGGGYTTYIPNQATGSQLYSFSRANQVNLGVDTDTDDSPYFYDLDGDGDLDMLMGTNALYNSDTTSSVLRYYRRNSALAPTDYHAWQLVNYKVGNLPTYSLANKNPNPLITDLDNDNNPELITNSGGTIRIYSNFINNLSGTFTPQSTPVYNSVLSTYTNPVFGSSLQMTAADLDGDQKQELIIGTHGGGLVYLKNIGNTNTSTGVKEELAAALHLNVYPNPANETLTVSSAEKVQVSLFDIAGREVLAKTPDFKLTHQLNVSNLKPGVYFLKFATSDFRSSGRTVLIQH